MRNLDSIFEGAEKASPNPFRDDVFASGITPLPGIMEIHADALSRCLKAFESLLSERGPATSPWGGSGRTLLLAAPRAGYGKSHLIGRVRAVTENLIAPVALPFDPSRPVGWDSMLASISNQYRTARCPQHPGCSLFEETARYFQSQSVRHALERGLVDEKELPETEIALRVQFRDVFDPKSGNRMVSWLTKRSPEIMDAVAAPLGARWGLEFDDIVFWNRFFQDAVRPKSTAFEQFRTLSPAGARDRLTQFLRIASDCRPVAFIADHLDGFFGSDTAGMRIAEILTELRFTVPRSVTLLCLNEDLWASLFEGKIPSAWVDRLTGEATALREMSPTDAESLLTARLHAAGWSAADSDAWLSHHRDSCLESTGHDTLYPREVLRRAARAWDHDPLTRGASRPSAPSRPATPMATPPLGRPAAPAAPQAHPLDSVSSFFHNPAPARPLPPRPTTGNVFSAADEPPRPATPRSTPVTPPAPTAPPPPAATTPAPPPPAQPTPPAPRAGARVDDPSLAARAAGIDPTRGLTNIEAIIAEIRGSGAKAVSETPAPSEPPRPVTASAAPATPASRESSDLERRLREIEASTVAQNAGRSPEWQPRRLEQLIRAVGRQFSAVGQTVEMIDDRPCLLWSVKGSAIRIGFEAAEHFSFWSTLTDRIAKGAAPGKVVMFAHRAAPVSAQSLQAIGSDPDAAARLIDIIEMTDRDLNLLYASETFLAEAFQSGQGERATRLVAKRLDPFWRRLGQPLKEAGTAG